jgi:predicted hydrocarbon binding protein
VIAREPSGLYYPNRFARHFLHAMEEVMGHNGLNMILGQAGLDAYIERALPDNLVKEFDFAALASIQIALEEMYGARGGRGMALRIGRASFAHGLRHFGAMTGMAAPPFRALPRPQRERLGLEALAAIYSRFTDQKSYVLDEQAHYRFVVSSSPMAWGRQSDRPVCHALVGHLQECLCWASNGYEYYVYETACRACGAENCEFIINKTPIGQR